MLAVRIVQLLREFKEPHGQFGFHILEHGTYLAQHSLGSTPETTDYSEKVWVCMHFFSSFPRAGRTLPRVSMGLLPGDSEHCY